jgi:phosphate transport system permease protein
MDMPDGTSKQGLIRSGAETRKLVEASLGARRRRELRFQLYGIAAIIASVAFVLFFCVTIVMNGYPTFFQTFIQLDINFDQDVIDPDGKRDPESLSRANYKKLITDSLGRVFPDVRDRRSKKALGSLVSTGAAYELRDMVVADPRLIGTSRKVWLPVDDEVDSYSKASGDAALAATGARFKPDQLAWINSLRDQGRIDVRFNRTFFTSGDSRDPEMAGILAAAKGSFFMLLVTMLIAFPAGVAAAIYLEEFAPRNRWTDLIEVNVNNLAAVPSIIFGLLGLALFINLFSMPRSAPLVGGLVLALMTLPTIIIASRSAIKAVPPSIRDAALGLGASRVQTVTHHVLPLALPGMLTGAILGMARALGETAPLLMIGMVAFVVDAPQTPMDPSSALPVQIYLWADSPERAFVERTSAAIMVLLLFLFTMNAAAVWLRSRFERRW